MATIRVTAIISAFNEGDIISPVIEHLVENDVQVYLIDNRSTDDTVEQAKRWLGKGLLEIETFPEEAPTVGDPATARFDWTGILRRKEELARGLDSDWFIHHDADEFREAPWPGMALRDAIQWVDTLGYNCIGFRVFNFPPIDDSYEPGADPEAYFHYCKEAEIYDRLQLKCWKRTGSSVSLIPSGGHEAAFANRRVFPIPFLMRHYPIRGEEHGKRKVFRERVPRFRPEERERGWHVQYDALAAGEIPLVPDIATLKPYDPQQLRLEALLRSDPWMELDQKLKEAEAALPEKDAAIYTLETRVGVLERLIAEKDHRIQQLVKEGREVLFERTIALERERKQALEEVETLHQRVAGMEQALEAERGARANDAAVHRREIEPLIEERTHLAEDVARLLTQLDYMTHSTSWRVTAPMRGLRRVMGKVAAAILTRTMRS